MQHKSTAHIGDAVSVNGQFANREAPLHLDDAGRSKGEGEEGKKSLRGKFFGWLFSMKGFEVVLSAAVGATLTVLVGHAVQAVSGTGKQQDGLQESLAAQTGALKSQTSTLKEGFDELTHAVAAAGGGSPETMKIIADLSSGVATLSDLSEKLSANALKAADLADYYQMKSELPAGVTEFWVSSADLNAVRIDGKNDVAVLGDRKGNGMELYVNFNGSGRWMDKGERIEFTGADKVKSALTYMGKNGGMYLFHRLNLE